MQAISVYWFCILQLCWIHWFSSVQLLSLVWLFVTPWTAAHQASLSITNSQSLLKLMSIELVMPSSHLILCHLLLLLPSIFPTIRVFSSESVLPIRWPRIGVSASASVLPVNIQAWFPLGGGGGVGMVSGWFKHTTFLLHFIANLMLLLFWQDIFVPSLEVGDPCTRVTGEPKILLFALTLKRF